MVPWLNYTAVVNKLDSSFTPGFIEEVTVTALMKLPLADAGLPLVSASIIAITCGIVRGTVV